MDARTTKIAVWITGAVTAILIAVIVAWMWTMPYYRVFHQEMAGLAKLKEAESSRQIIVQDAHARREAAKDLAQAEIERAKGVAEANKIIGQGLKDNHEYLMYLWIHSLGERDNATIIYVPTESGLPILEAGRFRAKK